jgi:hypothetical protein
MPPDLFALVIIFSQIGSHIFGTTILASLGVRMTGIGHHAELLLIEMESY